MNIFGEEDKSNPKVRIGASGSASDGRPQDFPPNPIAGDGLDSWRTEDWISGHFLRSVNGGCLQQEEEEDFGTECSHHSRARYPERRRRET